MNLLILVSGMPDKRHATWLPRLMPGMSVRFFVGRLQAAFRYALNFPFDFLFKCNEDTYVVPERLEAAFNSAQPGCIYVKRQRLDGEPVWVGSTALEREGYAHGGAGYFLSRSLVEYLANAEPDPSLNEDAWCGKYARNRARLYSTDLLQGGICPSPDNQVATCGGVDGLAANRIYYFGLRLPCRRVKLIAGIEARIDLLPHFLKYYRSRGVEQFIFGVWRGRSNPLWPQLARFQSADTLCVKSFDADNFSGPQDSQAQNRLRIQYVDPEDWCVYADLDEFHQVHGYSNFGSLVRAAEAEDASMVCGDFVDRITEDGSIPGMVAEDLEAQFPRQAQVTKLLVGGNTAKLMLARGSVEVPSGHHDAHRHLRAFSVRGLVHHYKWWGENLVGLLEQRARHYEALGLPWSSEPRRVAEHIRQNGRIVV